MSEYTPILKFAFNHSDTFADLIHGLRRYAEIKRIRARFAALKMRVIYQYAYCLLAVAMLQGCAAAVKVSSHDFCATAKPILVSKQDTLTDQTAKEVLAHNLTGRTLCGW